MRLEITPFEDGDMVTWSLNEEEAKQIHMGLTLFVETDVKQASMSGPIPITVTKPHSQSTPVTSQILLQLNKVA